MDARVKLSEIFMIPPEAVKLRADEMKPLIERIAKKLPRGALTFYGVLEKFMKGEWTCLVRTDENGRIVQLGATATYPDMEGKLVMQIMFIVGGTLEDVMEAHDEIERKCRENGIEAIEFIGRDGWLPMMKKLGYDDGMRLYRKEL